MYDKMLQYVKDYLENSGGEAVKVKNFPFRKEFMKQISFDLGIN